MAEPTEIDLMLGQALVALGQGMGAIRFPRQTVAAARAHFLGMAKRASATWDRDAVEALERVRMIGRLAAQLAVARGDVHVVEADFATAARSVETLSNTDICR